MRRALALLAFLALIPIARVHAGGDTAPLMGQSALAGGRVR